MRPCIVVLMLSIVLGAWPAAADDATAPEPGGTAAAHDEEGPAPEALLERADLLAMKQDWSGAETAYAAAADRDPDLAAAWRGLGYVRRKEGRDNDAIEAYEKALALTPDDPETLLGLGETHVMVGRKPDAARLLERLREVSHRDAATLDYVIRAGKPR